MKTERRHELKTNEIGVFLLDANDWLKNNSTKVVAGVIGIVVIIFAVNSMQRAGSEKAEQATRLLGDAAVKLAGDEWEAGFGELDTLIANAGSRDFKMNALFVKASAAERLAASPDGFNEDVVNRAEEAYDMLLGEFSDRALVIARAQLGLVVVAENRFATDGDPKHKDRARDLLTAISENKDVQGTPLQTLAVAKLQELDDTFTRVVMLDPPPPPPEPVGPAAPIAPNVTFNAPEGIKVKKLDGPPKELLERIQKEALKEKSGDTDEPAPESQEAEKSDKDDSPG